MKILSILTVLFILVGCSTTSKNITKTQIKQTMPIWYIKVPLTNNNYVYATSSEKSMEAALNSIYSQISKKISTSISVSQTVNKTSLDGLYDKQAVEKIESKSKIKELKFVEIIKKEKVNNEIYLMGRLDRKKYFEYMNKPYEKKKKDFIKKYKKTTEKTPLEQLIYINKNKNTLKQLMDDFSMLRSVNPLFTDEQMMNLSTYIHERELLLKDKISFAIKSSNEDSYIRNALVKILNKKNFIMGNQTNKDTITIIVENKTHKNKFNEWNIVQNTTTFEVRTNEKMIKTFEIESMGRSTVSVKKALNNATKDMLEQIMNKGFIEILTN